MLMIEAIGNLVMEPKEKFVGQGALAELRIAIDKSRKDTRVCFVQCDCWRNYDAALQLEKGALIRVSGSYWPKAYIDKKRNPQAEVRISVSRLSHWDNEGKTWRALIGKAWPPKTEE